MLAFSPAPTLNFRRICSTPKIPNPAGTAFSEWTACAEKTAREEPLKAAGYAFGAGLVFATFPIGKIVRALLSVAVLVRPAMLILGFVKVFEEIDGSRK